MYAWSSHEVSDSALVGRAKQQQAEAFDELVRRYRDALYRAALPRLRDPEAALDCVQETLLRAFESLSRFREVSTFSHWLYGILDNVCAEEIRKRTRSHTSPLQEAADPLQTHAVVEAREDALGALRALAGLPMALRTASLLYLVEGLDYPEAGAILGLGVDAVRMRLSRAWGMLANARGPVAEGEEVGASLAAGYHSLGRLLLRQGREQALGSCSPARAGVRPRYGL